LHGAFDEAVAAYPDRPFIITDARSWTYAEVAKWSRRIAAGLAQRGIGPGDKVSIILANYPEFVALKFAIARLGAVAVPINMLNRRDELRYLLVQSESVALVTMDRFRDNDYLAALDQIAPDWAQLGGGTTLPCLRQVFVFPTGEGAARPDVTAFAALEAASPADLPAVTVQPGDLCDILYTSGTTGSPKGVMLTHDMLTRTAFGSVYARAFEDGRRIIFSLPMYHVFGYSEGLLAAMWVGGAIVPYLRFDAAEMLDGIERHRASDALWIPTMSLALLDALPGKARDLSSLTAILASGGRAPQRLWHALREAFGNPEITTGYGMTEVTASSTVTRPDDPLERVMTTNGRMRNVGPAGDPAQGGRLVVYRVVDPESGAELPPGEMGELVAKGLGVTRGYYNKPEATAAAFDGEGWLKTGDLGCIDDDGYVTLLGRCKESYRCGGELVMPSEVEDVLTSRTDILQAHVVPVPDERMGEIGVAFLVPAPGTEVDPAELQRMVAERVARFKVPRHFLLVSEAEIPITASGRARKFLLSQLAVKMLGLS
jgi:fatty-acyl-CoA synthase